MPEYDQVLFESKDRRYTIYVNGKRYRWWHRLFKRLPGGARFPEPEAINADTFTDLDGTTLFSPPEEELDRGAAWHRKPDPPWGGRA